VSPVWAEEIYQAVLGLPSPANLSFYSAQRAKKAVHTTSRYTKQRPDVPFDGATCTRYDNGYELNKAVFTVDGADLLVRFCATIAPKKTIVDFCIPNFEAHTALSVITNINDYCVTPGIKTVGAWGGHFEGGIHEIWKVRGLPLGYLIPIARKAFISRKEAENG
jgi:hypothetical protein